MRWRGGVNSGLSKATGYRIVRGDAGSQNGRRAEPARSPRPKPPAPGSRPGGGLPQHYDEEAKRIIRAVKPRTMTAHEKLFALIVATRHVVDHAIPGDI